MGGPWGISSDSGYRTPGVRPVSSVQVAPESVERQRFASSVAATCVTPSDVIARPPPPHVQSVPHVAVVPVTCE